jgi:cytochrome c biogenesis protein CcmG/thiol:disulfide interchange protein DsbE
MSPPVDTTDVTPQGGRHLARTTAIVVGIVLVALIALLATRKTGASDSMSSSVVGKAVPQVKGTTLEGQHFDVDQHLNQFVVIDFFGSWCAPCHDEQGELVKFANEHAHDPNVAMVGIMYRDKQADAQSFYRTTHATWPILNDDGTTAVSFGVTGVPETYVVDPNGEVVAKFEAGITAKALDQVLSKFGGGSTTSTSGAGAGS